jgi:hypothetical protein
VSEQVILKSFGSPTDWTSTDGKIALTFYDCVFDRNGADFEANWGKKQGTGEPTVGESLEGEFFQKDGKWRFRKASKPQGDSSDYHSSSKSNGKSPDQTAAINRAVALKILAPTINADGLTDSVKATVADIEAFMATASGAETENERGAPLSPSPSQTPDVQGISERLSSLLEAAGENGLAATLLTNFAVETLSESKQGDCITALQGDGAGQVVAWLRDKYVQANGELPEAEPIDLDIPL